MRLTILGQYGPYPPAGGACSGYLLSEGKINILFDAGPGVLSRLLQVAEEWENGLRDLHAVVLSHLHMDHCSDALAMRYLLDRRGISLPLFLPDEPTEIVSLFQGWGGGVPNIMKENETVHIGGMKLSFYRMRHPVKAFGTRVEAGGKVFAYTGDTNTAEALPTLLKNADFALLDACFTDSQWAENLPHLSARLAAEAAYRAHGKHTFLTHFNPDTPLDTLLAEAREANPEAALVQAGNVYELGEAGVSIANRGFV